MMFDWTAFVIGVFNLLLELLNVTPLGLVLQLLGGFDL